MKTNKIILTVSIFIVICAVTALSIFSYSFNSKTVSLQQNVYGLNDINRELEQKLSLLEKKNQELEAKAEGFTGEKEVLNKKIQELEARLAELEEQKKSTESASFSSVKPRQKIAYLTFDDGPSVNTEKILDILRRYGIKATFFVVGKENMTGTYKKILEEGHVLGNHSYSHDYKTLYTSPEGFLEDFNRLNIFLKEKVGYEPDIFRFPGGSKNASSKKYGNPDIMKQIITLLEEKGVKYFDWNVTSADADISGKEVPKDLLVKNILSGAQYKRTAIILMHDSAGKETTVEALPEVIEGLTEQGFKFNVLTKNAVY